MTVIGLCALAGSGGDEVISALTEHHSFIPLRIKDGKEEDDDEKCPSGFIAVADPKELTVDSVEEALSVITANWHSNYVVINLRSAHQYEILLGRPFFMVLAVAAPTLQRLSRLSTAGSTISLDDLVRDDDKRLYTLGLADVISRARLTVVNDAGNSSSAVRVADLIAKVDFKDERWTRPSWDDYFMRIAELASKRSNCMKRSVGCVIVKDKRVVATGYNGTARGLINCCHGGCPRCNNNTRCGESLDTCLCLHAEDNALLEAGRVRCEGGTLYCTYTPCLNCSIKLVQCGISRIVFAKDYSIAHDASHILRQASVQLDKFSGSSDLPTVLSVGSSAVDTVGAAATHLLVNA
jgi:dCMP deaminase